MGAGIGRRLSKLEESAAKGGIVQVEFWDLSMDSTKMDLLDAVRLFTQGKIRAINAITTPSEARQCLSKTIQEIENYINSKRERQ